MQRILITVGLLTALIGLLWPWIAKLGLGILDLGDPGLRAKYIRLFEEELQKRK